LIIVNAVGKTANALVVVAVMPVWVALRSVLCKR